MNSGPLYEVKTPQKAEACNAHDRRVRSHGEKGKRYLVPVTASAAGDKILRACFPVVTAYEIPCDKDNEKVNGNDYRVNHIFSLKASNIMADVSGLTLIPSPSP